MDRFDRKMDDLLKGQQEQALAIQRLELAIGNGLSGEIKSAVTMMETLSEDVKSTCHKYDQKLADHDKMLLELNSFAWFREWANKFKESLVRKLLTIAVIGGTFVGLMLFYDSYIKRFVP